MFHNPGGDWHPGWGIDLMDNHVYSNKFMSVQVVFFVAFPGGLLEDFGIL